MTVNLMFPPATSGTANLSADNAGRTLTGLAVPFGIPSSPSQDGARYQFSTPPENADELIDVVREHDDDALVGVLAAPWEATETGLNATTRMFATSRGNDALTEYQEGARTGYSVSAAIEDYTEDDDGIRHVGKWSAAHLGLVRRPAFQSARITANASEGAPMDPKTKTPAADVVELPTVAELAAKVAEALKADKPAVSPLAQFASFAEFAKAFTEATPDERDKLQVAFAVAEQVTPNNPGVMPPAWRTEIKANIDARRPVINGFGSIGLPPAGLDSNWPFFDGNLDDIIKPQLAELTELEGVRIDIEKASEPIKTAGTVSTISYQLLMRSSPSYLQMYLRICMAAWARYTEAKFENALVNRATNAGVLPSITSAKAIRSALFAASDTVEDAVGAAADLVYVDKATFVALGGVDDLYNGKYGTQNVAGTASAASLQIEVNGLRVRKAPFFPAATMLVGSSEAAKFAESGPMVATEEDVKRLGRNVAVWGMYEDAEVYFPGALQVYKAA